jgi:type II secretory pathway pseudopilin PulG
VEQLRRAKQRCREESGFTLIELIVFSIVMLFLVLGVFVMLEGSFKSSAVSYSLSRIEDNAREALSMMVREVRVATSIDFGSTSSQLTITGDLDGDDIDETTTFRVADGSLLYGINAWVDDVDVVTFSYFEADGDQLSPGAPGWNTGIRKVSMVIQLSRDALGIDTSRTFEASVALRNSLE